MSTELIITEINPELTPRDLVNDAYYIGNDHFIKQQIAVNQEIQEHIQEMEPLESKVAKLYSQGKAIGQIAKEVGKRRQAIDEIVKTMPVKHLVHLYQCLELHRDGPNEIVRKQMLWRIAVNNQEIDPKESIKALAELNKMAAPKGGTAGGAVQIIINNAVMPRGALDG